LEDSYIETLQDKIAKPKQHLAAIRMFF